MKYGPVVLAAVIFASLSLGDDFSSRTLLVGQWQNFVAADQNPHWTIEQKGEELRVGESKGEQKLLEIQCKPVGVDCPAKDSGKNAKISMYFNGAALVQLETKGSEVIKRRFIAKGEDSMDVEIIPIVPSGSPETLHMKRVPGAAH